MNLTEFKLQLSLPREKKVTSLTVFYEIVDSSISNPPVLESKKTTFLGLPLFY